MLYLGVQTTAQGALHVTLATRSRSDCAVHLSVSNCVDYIRDADMPTLFEPSSTAVLSTR